MDILKANIGVLAGGISPEREVSLISGRNAYEALCRHNIRCELIDINTSDSNVIKTILRSCKIDAAFIALHGEFGEDGKIQTILEGVKIPYTGSGPIASFRAMDKIVSKELFIREGIRTPAFKVMIKDQPIPRGLKFPLVVKPHYGGSSIGITIVKHEEDLPSALSKAFSIAPLDRNIVNQVLLEEFIDGRELTIGILADKALEIIEIVPKQGYYDYQNKYGDNTVDFFVPAVISADVYCLTQQTALRAHQVLGCRDFSRVDIRLNRYNIPYVLEVNSIPGLTSHSLLPMAGRACGIDFDQLIIDITKRVSCDKK